MSVIEKKSLPSLDAGHKTRFQRSTITSMPQNEQSKTATASSLRDKRTRPTVLTPHVKIRPQLENNRAA